jgi:hypothetical protein
MTDTQWGDGVMPAVAVHAEISIVKEPEEQSMKRSSVNVTKTNTILALPGPASFRVVLLLLASFLSTVGQAQVMEKMPPNISWHTRACDGTAGMYSSVGAAQAQLAGSCSAPCIAYGVDTTPIDGDRFYAGANIYSPCLPRSTFEYMYDADTIVAIASCDPGYTFHEGSTPGASQTSGYCSIRLVQIDDTRKPCDMCVGNPIMPGIGNKRQEDVDYVGAGIPALKFSRIYNSASQFGRTWKTNYERSITFSSGGTPIVATINRPDGSCAANHSLHVAMMA